MGRPLTGWEVSNATPPFRLDPLISTHFWFCASNQMHDLVARFPPPDKTEAPVREKGEEGGRAQDDSAQTTPLRPGSGAGEAVHAAQAVPPHRPGSGADFLLSEVVDMLGKIRCEGVLPVGDMVYTACIGVLLPPY